MVILKIQNWEDFHCMVLGTLKIYFDVFDKF